MKKGMVFLCLVIFSVFIFTATSTAQAIFKGFSLKLSGGLGTWSGGDMNMVIEAYNSQFQDVASHFGASMDGSFNKLNWGTDFEGEFIMDLTRNIGVGIGIGYIHRKKDSSVDTRFGSGVSQSFEMEPQFTAIPITLSAYYHFPLAAKMDAFLKAGVGYYMGKSKFNVRDELEIPGFPPRWQEEKRRASSNSFGFHGGIGLEFNLLENIAFFLEGIGRYAKLKDWDVDVQYRTFAEESGTMSGTWYIVEVLNYATGKYYKVIITSVGTPSVEYFRNPKKAEISYSGISLRVGIKIVF